MDLQRRIDSLSRLAESQKGKPEGESARRKIEQLKRKYPGHGPDWSLRGIDLTGRWTASTPEGAVRLMFREYRQRARDIRYNMSHSQGERERGIVPLLPERIGNES